MSTSSNTINVTCFPSTTQNRAGSVSTFLICAIAESVFDCALVGASIFILTPFSLAFWNAFLSASDFLASPCSVVIRHIVFSAFFIVEARWLYRFPRPFIAPVRSAGSTSSMPCLCSKFRSPRTSLFFKVSISSTCMSASSFMDFFTLSSTSAGGTAMYLIGLPSFIITNPFLSRLSSTS